METSETLGRRFADHPRPAQSSLHPWQDALPLLLNYFPDILSSGAHRLGRHPNGQVKDIETLEEGMVSSQTLALETFKKIDTDSGRAFSPFLLLDPQNKDAVGDYGVFATRSLGDFLDWSELRDKNLVNAVNGTFKPSLPSPPQYPTEHSRPNGVPRGRIGKLECGSARISPRPKWNQVHKPVGAYHGKKSCPGAIFRFNPKVLRFRNYVPGGVYEVSLYNSSGI